MQSDIESNLTTCNLKFDKYTVLTELRSTTVAYLLGKLWNVHLPIGLVTSSYI